MSRISCPVCQHKLKPKKLAEHLKEHQKRDRATEDRRATLAHIHEPWGTCQHCGHYGPFEVIAKPEAVQ